MRRYGLACDQMLKTTLVNADGDVFNGDSQRQCRSFLGRRGAGGGHFGINTSLTLQTVPVQDLIVFRIAWNSNPEDLYAALVDALAAAPATLGSRLALDAVTPRQLAAGHDVTIRLLGQIVGTPADLADILEPAYRVAEPSSANILVMSYWDAQINFLAEPGPPDHYQEKSASSWVQLPRPQSVPHWIGRAVGPERPKPHIWSCSRPGIRLTRWRLMPPRSSIATATG